MHDIFRTDNFPLEFEMISKEEGSKTDLMMIFNTLTYFIASDF